MNPELSTLFSRRSVRLYASRDVDERLVRDMLEAAMAAPSAVAKDPWDFVVVRDRAMLAGIAQGLPNGQMLREAALGIVVCGDLDRAHDQQLSYLLQDCSAAIENLLLAASTLGLGALLAGRASAQSAWRISAPVGHPRFGHSGIRDFRRMAGRASRAANPLPCGRRAPRDLVGRAGLAGWRAGSVSCRVTTTERPPPPVRADRLPGRHGSQNTRGISDTYSSRPIGVSGLSPQ